MDGRLLGNSGTAGMGSDIDDAYRLGATGGSDHLSGGTILCTCPSQLEHL